MTDENISFSIGTPGYWGIPNYLPDGVFDRLKEFMELRSENDIELYVKDVEKRGARMEIENSGYKLAGFDHLKVKYLQKHEG